MTSVDKAGSLQQSPANTQSSAGGDAFKKLLEEMKKLIQEQQGSGGSDGSDATDSKKKMEDMLKQVAKTALGVAGAVA
jgi:hypothetical protein